MWRLAPLEDVRSDIHSPAHFHVRGPTNGPIISWGPCSIMLMITVPSVDSPRQWVCPVSGFARQWARPMSGLALSVGIPGQLFAQGQVWPGTPARHPTMGGEWPL